MFKRFKVSSLEELEVRPFSWKGRERIDLSIFTPFSPRTLFEYAGLRFTLVFTELPPHNVFPQLFEEETGDWWEGDQAYQGYAAIARKASYLFVDANDGQRKEVEYFLIEMWEAVPFSIRDVLFYRELRKAYYFEKGGYRAKTARVAHTKAKKDERTYVERFLSEEERILWEGLTQYETERSKTALREWFRRHQKE